jgi:hypothetical protein
LLRLGFLPELADCLLLKAELEGELREREEADEFILGKNVVELESAPLGGPLEFDQ